MKCQSNAPVEFITQILIEFDTLTLYFSLFFLFLRQFLQYIA